jgi:hypothetical protein
MNGKAGMGRRVQESLQVQERSIDERVIEPVTRRSVREAEARKRSAAHGGTSDRGTPPSRTEAVDPVYRRRGTPAAGWRRAGLRKRIGSVVVVGGLAAGGLWVLGGSTAQAQVSTGTFILAPGTAATIDSGARFANGSAAATFAIPGPVTGGGLYVGLQTRSGQGVSYGSKARIWADGHVTVGLSKQVNGTEQRLGDIRTNIKITGPAQLNLETSVNGKSPVMLGIRAWVTGQTKPDWQASVADATDTRIGTSGPLKAWSYLSSGASSPVTVSFTGLGQIGALPLDPVAPLPTATTPATATATPKPSATTAKPTPTPTKTTAKPTPKPTNTDPDPAPSSGGRPGAGNTGVPSGTDLTVHNGDMVITKSGATYDKLDVHGFVSIQAPNVTIKRSIIRGGVATGSRGAINVTNANAKNFLLVDSEIQIAHPSIYLDGINGANFTLRRVEVDGGVDTVHIHGNNTRVESSWLHGTNFFSLGANGDGGPTHNDGVQVMGGNNTTIEDNFIEGARNAAVMVTQDVSATTGLSIRSNWLNDGGCTVNIVPKKLASIGPITLADNKFGGTTRVANCAVARTATTNLVASNNVSAATGKPATINVWN